MLCLADLGEASRAGEKKNLLEATPCSLSLSVIFLGSIDERPYHLHKYRKIPKISLSKYKPAWGLYLENSPQIFSKTKQKW